MASFPSMEEFAVEYGLAIDDPNIKSSYEAYRESVWEWNSAISQARRDGFSDGRAEGHAEGHAEGYAEGRRKERDALVQQLHAVGIPEDAIAEAIRRAEG